MSKDDEMSLDEALKRLGKQHLIRKPPEAVPMKRAARSSLDMLREELAKEEDDKDGD